MASFGKSKFVKMTVAEAPAVIKSILRSIGYRKREFWIGTTPAASEKPMHLRSYWDGGSRDEYSLFTKTGSPLPLPVSGAPGFTREPALFVPQPDTIFVEHGMILGKPQTAYVTLYS